MRKLPRTRLCTVSLCLYTYGISEHPLIPKEVIHNSMFKDRMRPLDHNLQIEVHTHTATHLHTHTLTHTDIDTNTNTNTHTQTQHTHTHTYTYIHTHLHTITRTRTSKQGSAHVQSSTPAHVQAESLVKNFTSSSLWVCRPPQAHSLREMK